MFPAVGCAADAPPKLQPGREDKVMQLASAKLTAFDATQPEKTAYPNDGRGNWTTVTSDDWVAGFYPGCLWLTYEYLHINNDPSAEKLKELAIAWTAGMEKEKYNRETHDTGFMLMCSFGNGYRLTGKEEYKTILQTGAESLASRVLPSTGMIRAWNNPKHFIGITDTLLNLQLLTWAANENNNYLPIARAHAKKTIALLQRPNGSMAHVAKMDPETGQMIAHDTTQGINAKSAWSRGQAWAIYGFADIYAVTGDPEFLAAATKAADFYIRHLPPDRIPPADFDSNLKGISFKDSSAAAIAAGGLLKLALMTTGERQAKYWREAVATLNTLTSPKYLSEDSKRHGLLKHGARKHVTDPNDADTNTSLIFGDYYLLDALRIYRTSTPPSA